MTKTTEANRYNVKAAVLVAVTADHPVDEKSLVPMLMKHSDIPHDRVEFAASELIVMVGMLEEILRLLQAQPDTDFQAAMGVVEQLLVKEDAAVWVDDDKGEVLAKISTHHEEDGREVMSNTFSGSVSDGRRKLGLD